MDRLTKNYPTGDAGWGICIASYIDQVEIAVTGPQSGHYPGDVMTPEQADTIALGLIRAAQKARERAERIKREKGEKKYRRLVYDSASIKLS